MSNLYVLNEIITNSLNYNFLNIISMLSILSGIFVIVSKNPIVSVLFLIALFLTIACYLMMLGINFIGLSYLLVYVGAVSILFLFILMLINVRISELVVNSSNSIPLAIMIGILFNLSLSRIFPYKLGIEFNIGKIFNIEIYSVYNNITYILNYFYSLYNNELSFVTSQIWDGRLAETFHITSIGNIIYTNFPLWLILTSIILLLAMIGSILITIKQ
jgi:NADH-ubiquinone oxidoreductase chain 6